MIKQSKTSFIIITVLIVQIFLNIFLIRNSNILIAQNKNTINNLIDDIGLLKEEVMIVNNQVNDDLTTKLDDLVKKTEIQANVLDNYKSLLTMNQELNEDLKQSDMDIEKLIKEKETLNNDLHSSSKNLLNTQKAFENIKNINTADKFSENFTSFTIIGTHDQLTDTIILAIINKHDNKLTLISLPRDLYIEGRKINEYYVSYGIEKLNEKIQIVTGIKPDHYAIVNLQGFIDLVDEIGGISISIEDELIDTHYPGKNNSITTVQFDKGIELMNGERALIYARSRKSTSDFDRSKRQQQIIVSVMQKIKTFKIPNDIQRIMISFNTLQKNINTDLNILDLIALWDKYNGFQVKAGNVLSTENFLYSSKTPSGKYILLPKDNSFIQLQSKILNII